VQAYPESLLAKLADNEDDGVMEEKTDAIRLDRDPTLFAHVLKLLDKPAFLEVDQAVAEELREELDFYGLLPCSTMLPAAAFAAICSHRVENVVSSIVSQMAVLMMEKADDEGACEMGHQLSFRLSKPTDRWSDVKVRLDDTWTAADKAVDTLPPHVKQPLETRLRSLGYAVSIGRVLSQYVSTTRITLSWAGK
jgi:hypothetical protein